MFGSGIKVTLCVTVLLTGLAHGQPARALRNVKTGEQVPAFSVADLEGNALGNKTYQGKVLLLVFVRPDQEKSLQTLKVAQRILSDNGDGKLAVLAVSSKPQAAEHLKRLAAENSFTYPLALDPERKMYGDFGLLVAPTTLLIDQSGTLRYGVAHIPPNYEDRLRVHLDQLLGRISAEQRDTLLAKMTKGKPTETDSSDRGLGLAQALIERGKFDQAIDILTKLRSQKDSPHATVLLGNAYLELDKVEEAAKCLGSLADRDPAPEGLKLALARLELRRQNDGQAEKHLLDALKTSTRKGPVLYELGRLYERQGKLEQAVECYRTALEEIYDKRR